MKKESITIIKDILEDRPLNLFVNNAKLYSERADGTNLVWDDTNELLFSFRPNNHHYTNKDEKMIVEVFEYEYIENISSTLNKDDLKIVLDNMLLDSIITQETYDDILESYK